MKSFGQCVSRSRFDGLCGNFVQSCLAPIDEVLSQAGLSKDGIHKVCFKNKVNRVCFIDIITISLCMTWLYRFVVTVVVVAIQIVLTGGCTKMPLLQQKLQEFLPSATLLASISPDEVVTVGAAIQVIVIAIGPQS